MSGALAIFVKTPSLSPVKTRLAAAVGRLCAESFHLLAAEAVASVAVDAARQAGATAYWAVAEPLAQTGAAWSDLPRVAQGSGSLGERMHHVYETLLRRHGYAILLGADTPQIRSHCLLHATDWLAGSPARLALGESRDGGFWLFGGNRSLPRAAWLRATYSQPDTSRQFKDAMAGHGQWLDVDCLTDVDTAGDLPVVIAALQQLPTPTPAQTRLAEWMVDSRTLAGACR